MSDSFTFRSALNGFSRTDVVNYIEELSLAHKKALRQLQEENQKLREENDALQGQLLDAQNAYAQLKEENESLQQQIETLSQEAAELAAQAQSAVQDSDMSGDVPAEAEEAAAASAENDLSEQELAAYRRAEQAERNAVARARKLQEQLNLLCEQAKGRYLDAGEEISALTSDLSSGLSRLQETLADIQVIFDDAAGAFDALELPAVAE